MIGAVGKTAKGCSKVSKMVRYGSKIVGRIGNIALGSYQTGSIAVSLYDKHVVQGESWDWDSTVQLFSAGLFATTTVVSAKGLANDLSNYSSVKYDIQTSQCFVEGTLVLTKEGNKPIEEIQAGDLVYATDPETGGSGYKEVLRTFRKESDVLIHVFVNGEEIETTAVHPFWVENRWVSAKDLKEGDLLTLADGSAARISGVYGEKLDEAVVVYNFEVEEFHTYYVTDTGILVHNVNPAGGCGVTGNKSGSVSKKAIILQEGRNGTVVEVKSYAEADTLLKEAFPDYQKVNGIGRQDAEGIRKKNKMNRYKQGGAYHKDYAINKKTGRIYGHDNNNPHGMYPHINIKRMDGKTVMINILRGEK